MTERVFKSKITIGVLEDLNVKLNDMEDLRNKILDIKNLRIFLNSMLESGDPFTRDTPFEELIDAFSQIPLFLADNMAELERRREAMKEKLQAPRAPI